MAYPSAKSLLVHLVLSGITYKIHIHTYFFEWLKYPVNEVGARIYSLGKVEVRTFR